MPLSITDNQNTQVLTPVDSYLESAFNDGVDAASTPGLLKAIQYYSTLTTSNKDLVKDSFRLVIAAVLKILNIDKPFPTTWFSATKFNGTVVLAKLTTGGANGSLTVTDGLITAYTAPT